VEKLSSISHLWEPHSRTERGQHWKLTTTQDIPEVTCGKWTEFTNIVVSLRVVLHSPNKEVPSKLLYSFYNRKI
jgi:hypothetical protein